MKGQTYTDPRKAARDRVKIHSVEKVWNGKRWVCKICGGFITYHVQEMTWVHIKEVS